MQNRWIPLIGRVGGALAGVAALASVGVGSAAAHHSYGATYDRTRPITVTGTIQEVRYASPHVLVSLAGTREDGTSHVWVLDLPAPSRAHNAGLTQEALQVGTVLTVDAAQSRTNDTDLAPSRITFEDAGQTVRLR